MSLKAYDGMMTRKGLAYIQKEILDRFSRFEEASQNALAKTYVDYIISHVDDNYNIIEHIKSCAINESKSIKNEIDNINITDQTTLFSYLFQAGNILSTGQYKNDFMVELKLFVDCIDDKILINPSLNVKEHKDILLEFMTDWYCQNQSDQDESINDIEWKEREKDWYAFNEHRGFSINIMVFDPNHYWNNFNSFFRGDILYDKIIKYLPSDEKRKRKIAKMKIIDEKTKAVDKDDRMSKVWNIIGELSKKDNTEIDDYVRTHDIELINIDVDFLKNELLNPKLNDEQI